MIRLERALVAAIPALAAVIFWRPSYDVFNTVKATWIVLAVLVALVLWCVRAAVTGRVVAPVTPLRWPVLAFVTLLALATLRSDAPLLAVVGRPGRHTGLALYLAGAALFALVLRLSVARALAVGLMVAAVPVTAYGLLQAAGLDPIQWILVEGGRPVFSTLGNTNFLSAWLGIVLPLSAWAALGASRARWRVGAGLLWLAALGVAVASGSTQGPLIGVVGTALVVLVWLVDRGHLVAAAGLLAALAAVVLLVAIGVGPLGGVRADLAGSLATRTGKWQAAAAMVADHPLTGLGPTGYGDYYHAYRSPAVAVEQGLRRTADTPHSVPLEMAVMGGLPLALAWLAVVGAVGWTLARGLVRITGDERLLLAGLGGAWLAYQLQALVSIDVPPLAVLGWTLAAAIVVVAAPPRLQPVALPRLVPAAAALTLAAVAVVAVWPLRADLALGRAERLQASGAQDEARAAYERAVALGFWEGRYPAALGAYLAAQNDLPGALEAYTEAAARAPRGLAHALNVGRVARALGQDDQARAAYRRALDLDPRTPEVVAEARAALADLDNPG